MVIVITVMYDTRPFVILPVCHTVCLLPSKMCMEYKAYTRVPTSEARLGMSLRKSQGHVQGIFKDIFDILWGFYNEILPNIQQFCWNRFLWETCLLSILYENATKIMPCSTDNIFCKDFVENSRVFPQNSSIFPDLELSK